MDFSPKKVCTANGGNVRERERERSKAASNKLLCFTKRGPIFSFTFWFVVRRR